MIAVVYETVQTPWGLAVVTAVGPDQTQVRLPGGHHEWFDHDAIGPPPPGTEE